MLFPSYAKASLTRRDFSRGLALLAGALTLPGSAGAIGTALSPKADSNQDPLVHRDLSKLMVDSTMQRHPSAAAFGGWSYYNSLYMMGQYEVFKRTGEQRYLQYIKDWADQFVDAKGILNRPVNSLDDMQPGNTLLNLYVETRDPRYRAAIETIRRSIDLYPRTADGGFWHSATQEYKKHQLWLDGTFMVLPFMLRFARMFGGEAEAGNEAARQLLLDYKHNHADNGLLFHAYDESATAAWADNPGHHSHIFWGRAMGWYAMTLVDTIDTLPANHPHRSALIDIVRKLAAGLVRFQDPKTGLWFQIVDQPTLPSNWNETSCTCMFLYMMDVGVKRGYLASQYRSVAAAAYAGVLSQLSLTPGGLLDIHNVTEGTDVGETEYYLARKRNTNDPHGLGAFLIMNEEWTRSTPAMNFPRPVRR